MAINIKYDYRQEIVAIESGHWEGDKFVVDHTFTPPHSPLNIPRRLLGTDIPNYCAAMTDRYESLFRT